MALQIRRDTTANRTGITPAQGEPFYDTDTKGLFLGDGSTAGGVAVSTDSTLGLFNVIDSGAVGNGVADDTAAIQAAIDLAEVNGGVVYFPPGNYRIATGMTIDSDNVHIRGAGIGTTVIGWEDGDGGGDGSNGSYIFTLDTVDSVTFRDVSLTNGPAEDLGATNSPNAGGIIYASDSTKIRLESCYLYEIGGTHGFAIERCGDVIVSSCTFYMIAYSGMLVLDTCYDIKVLGCTFDTTNSSDVGYNRYLFATGADDLVGADATNLYFVRDLVVDNCTFKNNAAWEGLDTHGGDRVRFTNNTITGCYIGINAICATSSGTAYVTDAVLNDLIIENNTIDADGAASVRYGIVVRGHDAGGTSEPWYCENAKIIDNTILGYGGTTDDFTGAITVYRATNVEIRGNHIDEFAQCAVMLYALLSGVRVIDNVFYNAGATHLYADRVAGVAIRDVTAMDDILIDRNRFFDDTGNYDYGIYGWFSTESAGAVIGSNEFLDATASWTAEISPIAQSWAQRIAVGQIWIFAGGGSPDTAITAPQGSLYSDYTNAILYMNTDGVTAWSAV